MNGPLLLGLVVGGLIAAAIAKDEELYLRVSDFRVIEK